MQIYMSLSEEKKKALDVAFKAMEQADNIPEMYYPQVDGITPTVVAQADGEKTCGTCRNEDTYHCAECENKSDYEQAQADREYILKKDVMGCIGQTSIHSELARKLRKLPSVAIPNKTGHWITVSERLPEQYKEVIVTDIETADTYQSRYIGDGYWECDNGLFKNRIIAWQPKLKPYEPQESEDKDAYNR
jgi:hypothetical protein